MFNALNYSSSTFVKYRDRMFQWRWRLIAKNGKIIADSAEGYRNEADCDRGIALVKDSHRSRILRR